MKVKVIKRQGAQYLVVDDSDINDKHQFCSKNNPILLASIVHYFDSGCWAFKNYRLKENLTPSPYLSDNLEQIYNFSTFTDEKKEFILSKINHYKINDEGLHYMTYDCFDLNGDLDDKKREFIVDGKVNYYPLEACFSYNTARKKLQQEKEFWSNYNGNLKDDSIKLENNYRQPTSFKLILDYDLSNKKFKI